MAESLRGMVLQVASGSMLTGPLRTRSACSTFHFRPQSNFGVRQPGVIHRLRGVRDCSKVAREPTLAAPTYQRLRWPSMGSHPVEGRG